MKIYGFDQICILNSTAINAFPGQQYLSILPFKQIFENVYNVDKVPNYSIIRYMIQYLIKWTHCRSISLEHTACSHTPQAMEDFHPCYIYQPSSASYIIK